MPSKTLTLPLAATMACAALAACTSTGAIERNSAGGAAIGAVVGGAIGNNVGDGDAKTGAAIGAVLGGAAGAARGANQDREREIQGIRGSQGYGDRDYGYSAPADARRYYDERADRYYTVDPRTGDTYWTNGELRSRG